MKIIMRTLAAIGISCLFFGVLLFGVAMITGGDLDSVINHNIAPPYFSAAMQNVNAVVNFISGTIANLIGIFIK